jgi:hypothetical protein
VALSAGPIVGGMLIASRIRPPGADGQTGGGRADTQLVRDH